MSFVYSVLDENKQVFSIHTCLSQECPCGVVNEENFQHIYSQFFPQGGELSVPTFQPEELHL